MTEPIFQVPGTLRELEDESSGNGFFRVQDPPKLDCSDVAGLQRMLEGVFAVLISPHTSIMSHLLGVSTKLLRRGGIEGLAESETFSILYSFVR